MAEQLEKYIEYLDELLKTKNSEIFTNGGAVYASHLMSRLFDNTQHMARVYCKGFREELICQEPYWSSLNHYLSDPNKSLLVLVETDDYISERPIQLLKTVRMNRGDDTIQLRKIQDSDRQFIELSLSDHDCNFAVFDDSMFRFEYDPDGFTAFGSFNDPGRCAVLQQIFINAFNRAEPLLEN